MAYGKRTEISRPSDHQLITACNRWAICYLASLESVLLSAFLTLGIPMPVIPFVSPKGGSGKSTSALLLATFLTKFYDVTIIDADPIRVVSRWASGGNKPDRLTVISDVDEDTIEERIEDAASKTQVVIVDLEGTAAKIVLHAIAQADFVVIPMQGAHEDAIAASMAVGVILETEMRLGRPIPYSVLFTRTSLTIRSQIFTYIYKSVVNAGVPIFKTELNERDAYKAILAGCGKSRSDGEIRLVELLF